MPPEDAAYPRAVRLLWERPSGPVMPLRQRAERDLGPPPKGAPTVERRRLRLGSREAGQGDGALGSILPRALEKELLERSE